MFPVAVAMLEFIVTSCPVMVVTLLLSVAIFPVAVARFVFIFAIVPESAFCARESVK